MPDMPAPDKRRWLIESAASNVVKIIMREQDLKMVEAMEALFSSKLYAGLVDSKTGLYLESPSYLYELLEDRAR